MCLWLRPVDFGSQCKAWELDLWNGWNPTLWWGRRSEETSVTGPLANVIEHVLGIGALIFAMCFPDVTTHHFDTCSILVGALPWLIHFFIAIYIYKYTTVGSWLGATQRCPPKHRSYLGHAPAGSSATPLWPWVDRCCRQNRETGCLPNFWCLDGRNWL
jgi:hypothetical protein